MMKDPVPAPSQINPDTTFDSDMFSGAPIERKSTDIGGINDKIFGFMRPKKRVAAIPRQGVVQKSSPFTFTSNVRIKKKSLAERVRDQIKFPAINAVNAIINALALLIFGVGAYILYSELPTHVELVIGIILVSVAGNIIVRRN